MNKTLTQMVPRVLPPNNKHTQQTMYFSQKSPVHNSAKQATNNGCTDVEEVSDEYDSTPVCASVKSADSIIGSGCAVHRPALRCKPGPIQLGIGGEDVSDLVRQASSSTSESLRRDIDDRATTIVSGIVQSLRATSSITGH